jgi:hypothetical protein
LAPTSWKGQLPEGMKRIIASETTIFGTLTRTAVRDSLDAPIQRMAIPRRADALQRDLDERGLAPSRRNRGPDDRADRVLKLRRRSGRKPARIMRGAHA